MNASSWKSVVTKNLKIWWVVCGYIVPILCILSVTAFALAFDNRVTSSGAVRLTVEERFWLNAHSEKFTLFCNTEFQPTEFISESGSLTGVRADVAPRTTPAQITLDDLADRRVGVYSKMDLKTKCNLILTAIFSILLLAGLTVITLFLKWRLNQNITGLKESEERYRTILNEMSEGYKEVDLAGNFTFFNEAFLNLFGYSSDEMIGTNFSRYAADEAIAKEIYSIYNKIYRTGVPIQSCEWDILRKDGERRTLEFYASLVRDSKGDPTGFRGIVRDITQNRRVEQEREKLQSQLTQAQKMESVGRLAGGVAHDFNNMLGVILGHAELAMQKARNKQDHYSNLEKIQTTARRSADLTKQLLAFARKQIIEPKILDLNHTLEKMLSMLRRLIGENIDLSWLPARELWSVKMDPSQVDQILANLCVNARDAITGVGKLTIETGMKTFDPAYCADHAGFIPGDFVMLAVSDDGCGMDKEILNNLFEPFFTTKDINKGTGLGLATVYGIVKQNNGFINVYSEPDQGSTFRIYLPRQHLSAEKTCADSRLDIPAPTGNETILLVEDESDILDMTRTMLEEKGYSVLSAATPTTAIEMARAQTDRIHLLITDVIMPEMNGRDLAEHLRDIFPEIKLLFMSGYTANVIVHQGMLNDGVAFLQKPFSIMDLAQKVREVLD